MTDNGDLELAQEFIKQVEAAGFTAGIVERAECLGCNQAVALVRDKPTFDMLTEIRREDPDKFPYEGKRLVLLWDGRSYTCPGCGASLVPELVSE